MNIQVVYENKDFVAVNKPAGLLVHPIKISNLKSQISKTKEFTLVDWILEKYPEVRKVGDDSKVRPGIVHRLDKETSGILLVPKNQAYFEYLKKLFQSGEVKKTYFALVFGRITPKKGIIDKPIGLKSGSVKRTVFTKDAKMVKSAVSEYKVKKYLPKYSLLEVYPKTGRTHQIRVHLASLGYPVVGDRLYGKKKSNLGRLFLHAYSLEFTPRPGEKLRLTADLPPDLTDYLRFAKTR